MLLRQKLLGGGSRSSRSGSGVGRSSSGVGRSSSGVGRSSSGVSSRSSSSVSSRSSSGSSGFRSGSFSGSSSFFFFAASGHGNGQQGGQQNGTGTLAHDADIRAIAALCAARGATLIVDEIYQGLVYEGNPQTALVHSDQVVVINSFSKYFHMTGWRLGWMAAPVHLMSSIERLAQNLYLAPPTPAQYAALAAFSAETLAILEARRLEMRARRDFLLPALRELGFGLTVVPSGAFYLYADVSRFSSDSFAFSEQLLEQAGVAITPGIDFGAVAPQRYVRFAYTRPLPVLREAVSRIRDFLTGRQA